MRFHRRDRVFAVERLNFALLQDDLTDEVSPGTALDPPRGLRYEEPYLSDG